MCTETETAAAPATKTTGIASAPGHPRPFAPRAWAIAARVLLAAACAAALPAARADLELAAPDGRRVVLKDDGTWSYLQPPAGSASAPAVPEPEAELQLLRRTDLGNGCRFVLMLDNRLPYEIRSIVPYVAAQRADGVAYDSSSVAFLSLRPGATQERTLDFRGVGCGDIARLQVSGGDRCELGDLNKFSDAKGQCLARVKVVASPLLKFEK